MVVTVHFHTTLQQVSSQSRTSQLELELPEGSRLADLLDHLEFQASDDLLLVVNRKTADPDQVLAPGDRVDLIPALSGG